MRIRGSIKIAATLGLDVMLIAYFFGMEASIAITSLIMFYAWLGEYTALIKNQAAKIENISEYSRLKITRSISMLGDDIREISGISIEGIKVYVIPVDEINAYSFGLHNIAVTQGALKVSDELTLNAILAHEISHSLCMDAMFKRIIFANVTAVMLGITIISFVVTSFVWGIFLAMCLFGICGGLFSLFCVSGISKAAKGMFRLLQYMVIFLYQSALGLVSRGFEYRADMYACILGYAPQLKYFLATYTAPQEGNEKSLTEVLYASHPSAYKRIMKMEEYDRKNIKAVR